MSICVSQEAEAWIIRHERCSPEAVELARRRIEEQICHAARPHLEVVCDQPPTSAHFERYIGRIWHALEYHWKRLGENRVLSFRRLLERAEAADLEVGTSKASLLYDVILAQALEFNENKAAEMFEIQYMPEIRSNAQRNFGRRGFDLTENFACELIVPSEGQTPKIAKYHGRTFLRLWLRAVVYNHCVSAARKVKDEPLTIDPPPRGPEAPLGVTVDRAECQKLLRPIFKAALQSISAEDCVLLKMLFLDGVPQNRVAKSLAIHSGNVTRRHQKAAETVFSRLRELACQTNEAKLFESCIESALVGHDPVLRDWLGGRLGTVLSSRSQSQQPGGQPK